MVSRRSTNRGHPKNRATRRGHRPAPLIGLQQRDNTIFNTGGKVTETGLTCAYIGESEKNRIFARLSPESLIILKGTNRSDKEFIPSFKETDNILLKAAQRTYKTHGTSNR